MASENPFKLSCSALVPTRFTTHRFAYVETFLFVVMGFFLVKTIAVSDDVHELLKRAKVPGESYSNVIRRGLKRSLRLSDIAGSKTITTEQWKRTQQLLKASDQLSRKKLGTLLKDLS